MRACSSTPPALPFAVFANGASKVFVRVLQLHGRTDEPGSQFLDGSPAILYQF